MRKEFERVTPESVQLKSEDIMWLLDQLESGFTEPHGLIIMRHGKVCAEGWWSPYAKNLRHGQQSHSKTYAATAVGIAYTEGLLELDERIIDIFPEYAPENPSDNLKKMTIHHVLCMGTGMVEEPEITEDWIKNFLHMPVVNVPGTTYMYNNTSSSLLGAIVRKKTGLGLVDFLKPRLFDKIGINCDNHKWMTMPDGLEAGGGGLLATTEDNLRLMKLYADGGVWDGERILADDYVKKATSFQNASASEAIGNPPAKDNFVGYGYQIWMCRPKGVYRADGAMGQFTIVIPDMDMIIAITENAAGGHWAQKTLDVMWEYLAKIRRHDSIEMAENEPVSTILKRRMNMLAIPNEKASARIELERKINGRKYVINNADLSDNNDGLVMTEYAGARMLVGYPVPPAVEEFDFEFKTDECIFNYKTSQEQRTLHIAMDGTRRFNLFEGLVYSQALMNAFWENENELHVITRWVEGCSRQERVFKFVGEDAATVEIVTRGSTFVEGESEPVIANVYL